MEEKYKNESYELFDKCSNIENKMFLIYIVNIVLMVIACFDIKNIICSTIVNYSIIILSISYVFINAYNDIFLKNNAEKELRKTMIADAYDVNLTQIKSNNYYNNGVEPSIERMGLNTFESILYTSEITGKMIIGRIVKIFFLVVAWIVVITQIRNIELTTFLTQSLFSLDVLADFIKLIYYNWNVRALYDDFYKVYVTDGYKEKDIPIVIEYVMEYECLKNYCKIILPNKLFDEASSVASDEWNKIIKDIESKYNLSR